MLGITVPPSRKLGIGNAVTIVVAVRDPDTISRRRSIRRWPSTFSPTKVSGSSFVLFAPQYTSRLLVSSTISDVPVARSTLVNFAQFCRALTCRHHRITSTRTASQSARVLDLKGLPTILADIGLGSATIFFCKSGRSGKRQAWYSASEVLIAIS